MLLGKLSKHYIYFICTVSTLKDNYRKSMVCESLCQHISRIMLSKTLLLKALTWRNDDQKDDDMKLSLFDVTVNKI